MRTALLLVPAVLYAQIAHHGLVRPKPAADPTQLSAPEVDALVTNAALAVDGAGLVVVVSDRAGNPLAIYRRPAATDGDVDKALSLARTGAFFSSNGTPLSSRTVRSISRVNFPEGIPNQPSGALYGIENTSGCDLGTSSLPRLLNAADTGYGLGMATIPGGVPLFRDGLTVIGGIGVAGLSSDDAGEYAAAAGALATGFFVRTPLPDPGAVYIGGFQLPYLNGGVLAGVRSAASAGGVYQVGPRNGAPAPDGWLAGPFGRHEPQLRRSEQHRAECRCDGAAHARANPAATRDALEYGDLHRRSRWRVLGVYRMPDSTIFLDRRRRNESAKCGVLLRAGPRPARPAGSAYGNGCYQSHDRIRRADLFPLGVSGTRSRGRSIRLTSTTLLARARKGISPRIRINPAWCSFPAPRRSIATANWSADSACRATVLSRTTTLRPVARVGLKRRRQSAPIRWCCAGCDCPTGFSRAIPSSNAQSVFFGSSFA
jgi:uncharacterized protein GlcG (DUF336 family)